MDLKESLTQTFSTNFMAYLHSHIAHVNTVGRFFASDHKLLQKVYEDLQDDIDSLAELLRTIKAFMPKGIDPIIMDSLVPNDYVEGDADELIEHVYDDLETLIGVYKDLADIADAEGQIQISNFAQDRLLKLNKHCWMLRATLDGRMVENDQDEDDYNY